MKQHVTPVIIQNEKAMNIKSEIRRFIQNIAENKVEIYNEFSLQHELGCFLRKQQKTFKVQFERNISFFGIPKDGLVKREIDISMYSDNPRQLRSVIELKFPRNGQYPEQMFSFCKDIAFIEQLKEAGFKETYLLILADDHNFYDGKVTGIYKYFRNKDVLHGKIIKPTGKKDSAVNIRGSYAVEWTPITGSLKYALIEAEN